MHIVQRAKIDLLGHHLGNHPQDDDGVHLTPKVTDAMKNALKIWGECYDKGHGLSSEEWSDVSFDIYLIHMAQTQSEMDNIMLEVHDRWNTSRAVMKFRTYFFNTWLPYRQEFSTNRGHRFWKWQVFHTNRGCSYTNNPNEHFNRVLKVVSVAPNLCVTLY
ncbi:hypothetical protein AC1031_014992 [Aphanomyces cochlioides]|nr:hypothetical protein AC1031_014992 [Aphanomyces cochlioides]